jgi:tRNA G10  N-methylase Trm11
MNMQSLCILGRQPALGIAELESLYGKDRVIPIGELAVGIDIDPCSLAFDRLGGSVKFCKVLTILDTVQWSEIQTFLEQAAPIHAKTMPEGKMQLGLSVYGMSVTPQRIIATGLNVKKAIRAIGRSVRLTPNKAEALSSAQVIHNHLTDPNGWELVFVRDGDKTICAQTIKVQNIRAYTLRDRERPKRDARVGMLPPKLAQIIINLATGLIPDNILQTGCQPEDGTTKNLPIPSQDKTILDPFCGTGVILQEAELMGFSTYGTDLESRMIDYSKTNLEWIKDFYPSIPDQTILETGDATMYKWPSKFDFIASETYLGQALNTIPQTDKLKVIAGTCNVIIEKFLRNISGQIPSGLRLCLAVPAWQKSTNNFMHLPLLDHLSDLGYNRVSFKYIGNEDLLYYRPDQIVARELIVITRK